MAVKNVRCLSNERHAACLTEGAEGSPGALLQVQKQTGHGQGAFADSCAQQPARSAAVLFGSRHHLIKGLAAHSCQWRNLRTRLMIVLFARLPVLWLHHTRWCSGAWTVSMLSCRYELAIIKGT